MTLLDALGHVFYIFIFAGILLLARKKTIGWLARFVGEVGWLGLGVALDMTSVWMWGCVFVCMDLYGFYSWRKHANPAAVAAE